MTNYTCIFCDVILNKDDLQNNIENTILFEDEDFIIKPAKGTMIEGYLMLIPKKHITGMAGLDEEKRKKFLRCLKKIKYLIKEIYGLVPMVLEHGSVGQGRHPESIVHAHIHLIPFNFDNEHHEKMIKYLQLSKVNLKNDFKNFAGKDYWLYIDAKDVARMSHTIFNPPRSIFLRLLAEQLGLESDYEWRDPANANEKIIEKTIEKLYESLKNFKI